MEEKKENKHSQYDLAQMQSLPLSAKLRMTQQRIKQWYEEYDGNVYISFSGGKDSTVLLDIVRKLYPDVEAVFCDTGLEYPEIRDFVKTIDNVRWLKPKMTFKEVLDKYGYPIVSKQQSAYIDEYRRSKSDKLKNIRMNGNSCGMGKISEKWKYLIDAPFLIGDKCCDVMKKNPAKKYEKETGNKPIIGTMANESMQRKSNWIMYGCNAFSKKRPTSQPISFWTEQDVFEYIKLNNLEYASVYGDIIKDKDGIYHTTKCERTGCVFCMYGVHMQKEENNFQRLKKTHPKIYEYCMKSKSDGGLGIKEVLDYMNIPY